MRPAIEAEKLGILAVVIANSGFAILARTVAKADGLENLRVAQYPGAMGIHDAEEIKEKIEKVLFPSIVDALSMSIGSKSVALSNANKSNSHEVVFAGTFDEINDFFRRENWSDGLPIVPPTIGRVEKFVKYAHRAPDDVIAVLPPGNLKATPWNIAVNAVMAGCSPQHMPLLIAAVEALGDVKYNLGNMGSTSALLPFVIVNGPIIGELGLQCAGQLISKGPNPVIGRAIGLIVRNIAGFQPGNNYMGTFGYPLVFALAENEQESPWEPLHVERGFGRNTSTVTVAVTNSWGPAPSPYSAPDRSGAQTALEILCKELTKKNRLVNFPGRGPNADAIMITLLLSPSVARALGDAGYSKQDVKNYLYENARMSIEEFEWITKRLSLMKETIREKVELGLFSEEYLGAPDSKVRILSSPDILHIVVCGDPNRNRLMSLEGAHGVPVTREVIMPPHTRRSG